MTKRFQWSRVSQFVIWYPKRLIQIFLVTHNFWKFMKNINFKNEHVYRVTPSVCESIERTFLTPHAFREPPIWKFDLFLRLQLFDILVNIFCMTYNFQSVVFFKIICYTRFARHSNCICVGFTANLVPGSLLWTFRVYKNDACSTSPPAVTRLTVYRWP